MDHSGRWDVCIDCRWLVPVSTPGRREIFANYTVGVSDGKIVALGATEEFYANHKLETSGVARVTLNKRHVLIPGFVNCHTHGAMSLLAGYADDLPLLKWLRDEVFPAEKEFLSSTFVEEGARLAAFEALRSGTTCLNDMYYYPRVAAEVYKKAHIRAVSGHPIIDLGRNDMPQQVQESLTVAREGDGTYDIRSICVHSLYTVDPQWHEKVATANRENACGQLGVVYHTHLHETKEEREKYEMEHKGESAVHALHRVGALNSHLVAAHCVAMKDDEISLMATSGASVCHCPRSNMKLASGFAPVAKMMNAGINVCLGTDSSCSNNSLDMLAELRFAALIAKAVGEDTTVVDCHMALEMATRNGAKALGLLDVIGSIEIGKEADLVAVEIVTEDGLGIPVFDPVSHLVYRTHCKVTDVWVRGIRTVQNNRVITVQPNWRAIEDIAAKLREFQRFRREEEVAARLAETSV